MSGVYLILRLPAPRFDFFLNSTGYGRSSVGINARQRHRQKRLLFLCLSGATCTSDRYLLSTDAPRNSSSAFGIPRRASTPEHSFIYLYCGIRGVFYPCLGKYIVSVHAFFLLRVPQMKAVQMLNAVRCLRTIFLVCISHLGPFFSFPPTYLSGLFDECCSFVDNDEALRSFMCFM